MRIRDATKAEIDHLTEHRLVIQEALTPTDLIPTEPTVVVGTPEMADALAHMHQYDDSEDGIAVLER